MPAAPLDSGNIVYSHEHGWKRVGDTGLSKLEYAAIQICGNCMSNPQEFPTQQEHFNSMAQDSVRLAKALFAELEKDND